MSMKEICIALCLSWLVTSNIQAEPKWYDVIDNSNSSSSKTVRLTARNFFELGNYELEKGNLDDAAQAYKMALEFRETDYNWRCYYRLAYISASQGQLNETKMYLEKGKNAEVRDELSTDQCQHP